LFTTDPRLLWPDTNTLLCAQYMASSNAGAAAAAAGAGAGAKPSRKRRREDPDAAYPKPLSHSEKMVHQIIAFLGGIVDKAQRRSVAKLIADLPTGDRIPGTFAARCHTWMSNGESRLTVAIKLFDRIMKNRPRPNRLTDSLIWLMELLFRAGLTFGTEHDGYTSLGIACIECRTVALAMLRASAESVDQPDNEGNTPLLLAIHPSTMPMDPIRAELVRELISRSSEATLNAASVDDDPPLFHAIRHFMHDMEDDTDLDATVCALLAAANEDGSGVDLLTTRSESKFLPDEFFDYMEETELEREEIGDLCGGERLEALRNAVRRRKAQVLAYRTRLVPTLFGALQCLSAIPGLLYITSAYVAPRCDQLIAAHRLAQQAQRGQQPPRRPAAAAAAAAAAAGTYPPP
jgi:hypothetical protein